MTEVREDKEKSQSGNETGEGNDKLKDEKEITEDSQDTTVSCEMCGRTFKNERALKTHERHCKKRQENGKSSDLESLKEELLSEMQTISEERMKLREEREKFFEEMRAEREKMKEDLEAPAQTEPHGDPMLNNEITDLERNLEAISSDEGGEMGGSMEMDLDGLAVELENLESEISTKVDFDAMRRMADDFKLTIKSLEDNINGLSGKIDGMGQELEDSGRKYGTYQHIIREMRKLDEKNEEILEEIGFGESMNVSKIPPKILESVYESTIEDIVNEIRKNRGTHDAESIINRTLEDIRTRTSGSELFFFDGRMLKTRNLANSIIHKLISARQVQTTYDELLMKLLEYLPGYKAKNFRAMIKLKSQEYAVDKTTMLLERFSQFNEDINHLQNMVGSVSNRQNTIELEINNITKSMVGGQELETLTARMEEFSKKFDELNETLSGLKETQSSISESLSSNFDDLSSRINAIEKTMKKQDSLPKKLVPAGVVELGDDEEEEKETETVEKEEGPVPLDEDEFRIFSLIPEKGFTFYRIKKEIAGDLTDKKIKSCLESLLVKGVLTTEKRGRHTVYLKPKETEV
jgi:uncharacterized coiled-coil DUF342 family protein